jgi:hypothetical protein
MITKKNLEYIKKNSLVFAVNVASKNLKPVKGANWVLHNILDDEFKESGNVLNLQVFTNSARDEPLGSKAILWDQDSNTLYQPWGLPENPNSWLKPSTKGHKSIGWEQFGIMKIIKAMIIFECAHWTGSINLFYKEIGASSILGSLI